MCILSTFFLSVDLSYFCKNFRLTQVFNLAYLTLTVFEMALLLPKTSKIVYTTSLEAFSNLPFSF